MSSENNQTTPTTPTGAGNDNAQAHEMTRAELRTLITSGQGVWAGGRFIVYYTQGCEDEVLALVNNQANSEQNQALVQEDVIVLSKLH